ncbi:MAG TPA: hypothetical protein VIL79_10545 [Thermoleophilia bacterium]
MGHDDEHRLELFIFPDGTSVEMIVFAPSCASSPDPSRPTRERDAGPAQRETQPGAKPTATQAPPPVGQRPGGAAHECPLCGSDLVHPVDWERNSDASWNLVLHCPNCETQRHVVLGREGVEAFNREIYLGSQALAREADSMTRRNFSEESKKFVEALELDLILPMDF